MGSNVMGYVYGCRVAIRHMLEAGGGRIVNITSVAGLQPLDGRHQATCVRLAVVERPHLDGLKTGASFFTVVGSSVGGHSVNQNRRPPRREIACSRSG